RYGKAWRDHLLRFSERRSCGHNLAQEIEHCAVGAERSPFLDHVGQEGELVLRRETAQEAIDHRRPEAVGLAVAHELPDAIEDEPARGVALGQESRLANIFCKWPHDADRLFGE